MIVEMLYFVLDVLRRGRQNFLLPYINESRVHNLHLNAIRIRKYISIVHSHALSFCAVEWLCVECVCVCVCVWECESEWLEFSIVCECVWVCESVLCYTSPSALKWIQVLASVGSLVMDLKNFWYSSSVTSSFSLAQIATLLLTRCQPQTSTCDGFIL